jgi:hypothetical protein
MGLISTPCAIEAAPELRSAPSGRPIRFDEVMDALKELDRQAGMWADSARFRRAARRRRIFDRDRSRDQSGHGPVLN